MFYEERSAMKIVQNIRLLRRRRLKLLLIVLSMHLVEQPDSFGIA